MNGDIATLSIDGRFTRFSYGGRVFTFMHGKDLLRYVSVKEWDNGYLVVECVARLRAYMKTKLTCHTSWRTFIWTQRNTFVE